MKAEGSSKAIGKEIAAAMNTTTAGIATAETGTTGMIVTAIMIAIVTMTGITTKNEVMF